MRRVIGWLLGAALLCSVTTAWADGFSSAQRDEIVRIVRDALKEDPSILREAVEALQADENAKQEAATRGALSASHDALGANGVDPVAGNPHGDVTIVEFFDTRCPYCRRLEPVMSTLLQRDGKVRLVYKDLPILGAASVTASRALLAAQRQEDKVPRAYEKLRESVMLSGVEQTKEGFVGAARRLGLDTTRLERDMDDPAIQGRLDANSRLAHTLGIQGTPALVIGDKLIPGAVTEAELERAVDAARVKH